jgi:hypothetical protein
VLRLFFGGESNARACLYCSGAVPLEDHPVPLQRLVRAPARQRRLRAVGMDLSFSSLLRSILQCDVLRLLLYKLDRALTLGIYM